MSDPVRQITSPSALDEADPLARFRDAFHRPDGVIYLDGHSLGLLPRATQTRVADVVATEWGDSLIRSWNTHDWIGAPARIGAKIACLIGAQDHEVTVADSTSVNLYKLITAACLARPDRPVVLAAEEDFPTDLYMIEGALRALGGNRRLRTVPRAAIADALDTDTALLVLTQVDYRTADVADMAALTEAAHHHGIWTLWDLSHSTGAVAVDLNAARADLAVGCGYKYLNGGPGAPSFLYVAERHHGHLTSPLSGWMGHAAPFAFEPTYRAAPGMAAFLCGTPPILSLLALESGIDLALQADPDMVAAKARALGDLFIARTATVCARFGLSLASPGLGAMRGGHVALRFEEGYALTQCLIARGIIGDFRAPDVLRFGFSPLTLSYAEVAQAADALVDVLETRAWDSPEYRIRAAVT